MATLSNVQALSHVLYTIITRLRKKSFSFHVHMGFPVGFLVASLTTAPATLRLA